jgi:multidrug efflux pump subunit AcrB
MITPEKINSVQAKIKAAIAQIEREENVKISFGSCRYDSSKYSSTMSVKTNEINDKVNLANERTCKMLGLDTNVIGKVVKIGAKTFVVTDIKTRNRTYPIIAECDGKSYKLSVDQVKRGLLTLK